MSIRKETPCDWGECPYSAEYNCDCEYWCGEIEPADDPELWETEAVECCPHCMAENTYPGWDVKEQGYIATCHECGQQIFLCDECQHADDNPDRICDWEAGKCFRGEIKQEVRFHLAVEDFQTGETWELKIGANTSTEALIEALKRFVV